MKQKSFIILLFFLAFIGCEKKEKDNPFDPNSNVDFSPNNVTATIISPYVIKLQWEITSASIDGFKIDKKESSSNWENDIAINLGNNTTSWTDFNCKPNTDYTYRIYAIAGSNTSDIKTITIKTPEGNLTGTFTDSRNGKTYKWVKIGNQTWMAENLYYIPQVCPPTENCGIWVLGYYGHDVLEATATDDYKTFGCLYDWETANSIAPEGWHLPTEEEWYELINYLGGSTVALSKLMAAGDASWGLNSTYTNESGFTALPGCNKVFNSFSCSIALFWAAIPNWAINEGWDLQDYMDFTNQGDCYFLYGGIDDLSASSCYFDRGGSVRCVKN